MVEERFTIEGYLARLREVLDLALESDPTV
jgi:hypothetical protein